MRNLKNLLDDDDVLDINNTYPGIVVRRGMGLLFVFFVILLSIMAFIPYPEKVEVSTVINPVSRHFLFNADTSRLKIQSLFKDNGDSVHQQEKIAVLTDSRSHTTTILSAPFAGFFYKGSGKTSNLIGVIQIDKKLRTITAIIASDNLGSVHLQEKVQINASDKEVPFSGVVCSITPMPFETKSYVNVQISDEDYTRFEKTLKQNLMHPINATLDIYDHPVSVLNKAFGVLGSKLKAI